MADEWPCNDPQKNGSVGLVLQGEDNVESAEDSPSNAMSFVVDLGESNQEGLVATRMVPHEPTEGISGKARRGWPIQAVLKGSERWKRGCFPGLQGLLEERQAFSRLMSFWSLCAALLESFVERQAFSHRESFRSPLLNQYRRGQRALASLCQKDSSCGYGRRENRVA